MVTMSSDTPLHPSQPQLPSREDMRRYFAVQRAVEFSETDMAGLVHFANFFRYMEFAEARFFEFLGEPLIGKEAAALIGWPRVRASCDYRAPLFFGDTLEIRLSIHELKIRALEYRFDFYRVQATPEATEADKIARGKMTTVRVCRAFDAPLAAMSPTGLPETLIAKLEPYRVDL